MKSITLLRPRTSGCSSGVGADVWQAPYEFPKKIVTNKHKTVHLKKTDAVLSTSKKGRMVTNKHKTFHMKETDAMVNKNR